MPVEPRCEHCGPKGSHEVKNIQEEKGNGEDNQVVGKDDVLEAKNDGDMLRTLKNG